ncbi:uncharacterized protein LOC144437954 [Glandiceps talaboti]
MSRRSSKLSAPAETPKTLIRGFLQNAETVKLPPKSKRVTRLSSPQPKPVDQPSAKKIPLQRRLTRSASKKIPQSILTEDTSRPTPKTLIKGFLQHAPPGTPAVYIPRKRKASPKLPDVQLAKDVPQMDTVRETVNSDQDNDSFDTREPPKFKRRKEQRMSVGTFGKVVQEKMIDDEDDDDTQVDVTAASGVKTRTQNAIRHSPPGYYELDDSAGPDHLPKFTRRRKDRMSVGTFGRIVKETITHDVSDSDEVAPTPADSDNDGVVPETQEDTDVQGEVAETSEDTDVQGEVAETSADTDVQGEVAETSADTDVQGEVDETSADTDVQGEVAETSEDTDVQGEVDETSEDTDVQGEVAETSADTDVQGEVAETSADTDVQGEVAETSADTDVQGEVAETSADTDVQGEVAETPEDTDIHDDNIPSQVDTDGHHDSTLSKADIDIHDDDVADMPADTDSHSGDDADMPADTDSHSGDDADMPADTDIHSGDDADMPADTDSHSGDADMPADTEIHGEPIPSVDDAEKAEYINDNNIEKGEEEEVEVEVRQKSQQASKVSLRRKVPAIKTTLPRSLTKNIFSFHSRLRVNPQAMESVYKGSERFLRRMYSSVSAYSKHAGRKIVTQADFELLMRRQRIVTDNQSLDSLIQRHLPLEYRQQLIPIARSGNVLEPKPK